MLPGQVPSLLNTWAIGDCASTGEMKTAVAAGQHARAVARNIVSYAMVSRRIKSGKVSMQLVHRVFMSFAFGLS